MNSRNPEYPNLLHTVATKMKDIVKQEYEPYVENAEISDIVHYELHVVCSFLMSFLIKLSKNAQMTDGSKVSIDHSYAEFSRIMEAAMEDWKHSQEATEH